jgi:5-methylthioadenosine/S-adenosylhomocysteine deaminase
VPSARTVIRNATIVSMDPGVGDVVGDIVVEGSRIVSVGPLAGDGAVGEGAEVIDASHMVAIPGMVDGHRHMWQGVLRGVASGFCLNDYFNVVLGTLSPQFRPEDVYAGNLLSGVEAINAGVTTVFDWSHIVLSPDHADEAVRAHRTTGQRIVYGYGFPVGLSVEEWVYYSSRTHPEDAKRMRKEVLTSDGPDELVTMGLALRGPGMAHPDVTEHDLRFGRELGIKRMSMHAGEPEYHFNNQTVKELHDRGVLADDVHFAHGNQFTAEDIRMVVGAGASITSTPGVELQMGLGFPMISPYLAEGGMPSFGVDTITAAGSDLFSQMRTCLAGERMRQAQPTIDSGKGIESVELTPRDYLTWATLGGARAVGLDDRVGSLTPGKQADIVLLDTKLPGAFPVNDPVSTIVFGMDVANVDTVMIGGIVRKRGGQLTGDVLATAHELAGASRDHIFGEAKVAEQLGPAWA